MIKQIIVKIIIMLIFGAFISYETVQRAMQKFNEVITITCLNNGAMVINGVTFECSPVKK